MSLIVSEIFEDAKLLAHPVGFTSQVSPTQVMSHLTTLDNYIVEIVNQTMPSLTSTVGGTLTVSDAQNLNGYDLDEALGYTQFLYQRDSDDRVWEIYVVMESDFMNPTRHPSGVIVRGLGNSRLLLPTDPLVKSWSGDEERSWWKPGDTITYRYIPLPSRFTKLTDELQSPDFARGYIVTSVALLIMQMIGGSQEQLQMFAMKEQSELKTFLMQLYKQARIHTPDRVSDSTFGYTNESIETLLR
jgi:hypothetical protein